MMIVLNKNIRLLTVLVAAGALLVAPVAGQAHHKPGHTNGPKAGQGPNGGQKSKRCKKAANKVGFVVKGTLVSLTTDNPATPASEASVTVTVTGANRHARNSGELAGTGTYNVAAGDAFKLTLVGYVAPDTPSAGDPVRNIGKIARTKSKCAPAGTTLADRYGDVNVRKVVVHDADPDA
jgi:hypothetical protein